MATDISALELLPSEIPDIPGAMCSPTCILTECSPWWLTCLNTCACTNVTVD